MGHFVRMLVLGARRTRRGLAGYLPTLAVSIFLLVLGGLGKEQLREYLGDPWTELVPRGLWFGGLACLTVGGLLGIRAFVIGCRPGWDRFRAARGNRHAFAKHVDRAIDLAVTGYPNQGLWDEIAAAALRGLADKQKNHRLRGNSNAPIVYCNFEAYAAAVTEIRETLERKCKKQEIQLTIRTLFSKPLLEWYLPLSAGPQAQLSAPWWDKYLEAMEVGAGRALRIKDGSRFVIERLMKYPPFGNADENNPAGWQLAKKDGHAVFDYATGKAMWSDLIRRNWQLYPKVAAALSNPNLIPDATVRLVVRGGSDVPGWDFEDLMGHFSRTYSNRDNRVAPVKASFCFLESTQDFPLIEGFDDLFVVSETSCGKPETQVFALAHIADEISDVYGLRLFPTHGLVTPGGEEITLDALIHQWCAVWRRLASDPAALAPRECRV